MNVFTRVTLRTLWKNRVRTLVTVVGILLSAAMFTAVATLVASFQSYLYRSTLAVTGDWHGVLYNLSVEERDALAGDSLVEAAFSCQNLGYAARDWDEWNRYLYVQGGDDAFFETMPVRLLAGRLPETPGELVVPAYLTDEDGAAYRLGDTLTLALGDRVWNGETLDQFTGYLADEPGSPGEIFEARETRTYTVVGLSERFSWENGMAPVALTVWDGTRPDAAADTYFRLTDPSAVFTFLLGEPIDGETHFASAGAASSTNSELLAAMGASRYGTYQRFLTNLGAILVGLIVFGSVALIYNAFSISVAERTQQFGLLSSVGATRAQIRRMVMTEALLVSLAGIPLGLLAGVLGIGVTLRLIGDRFSSLFGIEEVAMELVVSWQALALAAALALVTVLISAWVPSRRAMAVTALEAIRQNRDIRPTRRPVRVGPLTARLFGLPGVLARKHYQRGRRRYRATVVSLFMSVVLFISVSSFCTYVTDSVRGTLERQDYDLAFSWSADSLDSDGRPITQARVLDAFRSAEGVADVTAVFEVSGTAWVELTQDQLHGDLALSLAPGEAYVVSCDLYGVEDGLYRAWLEAQGLPAEAYLDAAAPRAVVLALERQFNPTTGRTETRRILRDDVQALTIWYRDAEKYAEFFADFEDRAPTEADYERGAAYYNESLSVALGAQTDTLPFGLNRGTYDGLVILLPQSYLAGHLADAGYYAAYAAASGSRRAAAESLEARLTEAGLPPRYLQRTYEGDESQQNIVLILQVFSYGFIALISLIAVANVFNTITTNLLLRRREMAMLRSVGMTSGGFRRMLAYECLLYGVRALLWGLPVAVGVTYLVYRTVGIVYQTSFYLPGWAVAVAVGGVFAVVVASMVYGWRRIRRDNPIDALRGEAL